MAEISKKKALQIEVMSQIVTLATSALGLVAALAWNSFIQELVNNYIKKFLPGAGLISLFIYALIVTLLAVVVTMNLARIKEKLEQKSEQ